MSFPRTRESQGAHSSKGDEALHQGPGLTSLAAFPGASVFPDGESVADHAPCCGLTRRPGVEWRRRADRRRGKNQDVCRFRAMRCGGLRWCVMVCDGVRWRGTAKNRGHATRKPHWFRAGGNTDESANCGLERKEPTRAALQRPLAERSSTPDSWRTWDKFRKQSGSLEVIFSHLLCFSVCSEDVPWSLTLINL